MKSTLLVFAIMAVVVLASKKGMMGNEGMEEKMGKEGIGGKEMKNENMLETQMDNVGALLEQVDRLFDSDKSGRVVASPLNEVQSNDDSTSNRSDSRGRRVRSGNVRSDNETRENVDDGQDGQNAAAHEGPEAVDDGQDGQNAAAHEGPEAVDPDVLPDSFTVSVGIPGYVEPQIEVRSPAVVKSAGIQWNDEGTQATGTFDGSTTTITYKNVMKMETPETLTALQDYVNHFHRSPICFKPTGEVMMKLSHPAGFFSLHLLTQNPETDLPNNIQFQLNGEEVQSYNRAKVRELFVRPHTKVAGEWNVVVASFSCNVGDCYDQVNFEMAKGADSLCTDRHTIGDGPISK